MTKSNSQINLEVAKKLGRHINKKQSVDRIDAIIVGGTMLSEYFDPCNSWTDAGPIIEQYRISLVTAGRYKGKSKPEDAWVAKSNHINIRNDNLLVAAMLVFLEMEVEL